MVKPDRITICHLDVVVMPNGEVIYGGKTLGWFGELHKHLHPAETSLPTDADIQKENRKAYAHCNRTGD